MYIYTSRILEAKVYTFTKEGFIQLKRITATLIKGVYKDIQRDKLQPSLL